MFKIEWFHSNAAANCVARSERNLDAPQNSLIKSQMEAVFDRIVGEKSKRDDEGYSTMLLFPKEFEMRLFLLEASKKHRVHNSVFHTKRCIVLTLLIDNIYENFYVFCMGESDIAFSFRLGQLLKDIGRKNLHIVLCGTCGGSFELKHKRGDVFRVNRAVKIDRGILNLRESNGEQTVVMTFNKFSESFCSDHNLVTSGISTICSNHILNIDPVALHSHGLPHTDGVIVDMETHEFFKTCELNGVQKFDCLRIVSDITDPKMKHVPNEVIYELNRQERKSVRFTKLLQHVIELSIESASVREEKPIVAPTQVKQRDNDTLCKHLKEAVRKDRQKQQARFEKFRAAQGFAANSNILELFRVAPDVTMEEEEGEGEDAEANEVTESES